MENLPENDEDFTDDKSEGLIHSRNCGENLWARASGTNKKLKGGSTTLKGKEKVDEVVHTSVSSTDLAVEIRLLGKQGCAGPSSVNIRTRSHRA